MSQESRTHKSRTLNKAIGIVPITIMVPDSEVGRFKTDAAYSRAQHMLDIVNSKKKARIQLLARKRSPWAHTASNLRKLDEIDDPDDRAEAREVLEEYRQIEDDLEHGDFVEDGVYAIDHLAARKVALGHKLMYLIGEE